MDDYLGRVGKSKDGTDSASKSAKRPKRALKIVLAAVTVLAVGAGTVIAVQARVNADQEERARIASEQKRNEEKVGAAKKLLERAKICVQDRMAYTESADGTSIWFQEGTPTSNLMAYNNGQNRDLGIGCVLDAISAPSSIASDMWESRKSFGTFAGRWGVWDIEWKMDGVGGMEVSLSIMS